MNAVGEARAGVEGLLVGGLGAGVISSSSPIAWQSCSRVSARGVVPRRMLRTASGFSVARTDSLRSERSLASIAAKSFARIFMA